MTEAGKSQFQHIRPRQAGARFRVGCLHLQSSTSRRRSDTVDETWIVEDRLKLPRSWWGTLRFGAPRDKPSAGEGPAART
jgi:hypothetical protein